MEIEAAVVTRLVVGNFIVFGLACGLNRTLRNEGEVPDLPMEEKLFFGQEIVILNLAVFAAAASQAATSRAARVIDTVMAGHRPDFWQSDRYSAQRNRGQRHKTCLAHLKRVALVRIHASRFKSLFRRVSLSQNRCPLLGNTLKRATLPASSRLTMKRSG